MTENHDLPDLKALLREHHPDDQVTLTYNQLHALHGELQRLLQSNDRLRKQNRKVRLKYDRLKAPPATTSGAEPEVDST